MTFSELSSVHIPVCKRPGVGKRKASGTALRPGFFNINSQERAREESPRALHMQDPILNRVQLAAFQEYLAHKKTHITRTLR